MINYPILKSTVPGPIRLDTDDDGMLDGWEVNYELNPLDDDATEDKDGDELSNLEEHSAGTDPTARDTDGDGMSDGWEVNFSLDPLVDDADLDQDSDELSNLGSTLPGPAH